MAWVENGHPISTPLLCAGLPTTRPGCREPHPAWLWMPPGMGNPQPPWATCSSAAEAVNKFNNYVVDINIYHKKNKGIETAVPPFALPLPSVWGWCSQEYLWKMSGFWLAIIKAWAEHIGMCSKVSSRTFAELWLLKQCNIPQRKVLC